MCICNFNISSFFSSLNLLKSGSVCELNMYLRLSLFFALTFITFVQLYAC